MSKYYDVEVMARHYDESDLLELARMSVILTKTLQVLRSALHRKSGSIYRWLGEILEDLTDMGQSALDAIACQDNDKLKEEHYV